MTVEMFVDMPFAEDYRKLAANPDGFPALVEKLIALEKEPMAWEEDVKALKTPVLIIAGDADVATLEHSVAMFRLLGGGVMGDMGKPLPASRLAVLPATSHTAVITQADLLHRLHRAVPEGRDAEGDVRVGTRLALSASAKLTRRRAAALRSNVSRSGALIWCSLAREA